MPHNSPSEPDLILLAGDEGQEPKPGSAAVIVEASGLRRATDVVCVGLSIVDRALDALLVLALVSALAVTFTNIMLRKTFGNSLLWSNDAAELSLGVIAFLGMAAAANRGMHMSVQVVVDKLPHWISDRVRTGVDLIGLVILAELGRASIDYVRVTSSSHAAILGISGTWYALPLPTGAALTGIFIVRRRLWRRPLKDVIALGSGLAIILALLFVTRGQWESTVDPSIALWLSFGFLILVALLGLPIGFAFAGCVFVYTLLTGASPAVIVAQKMGLSIQSFVYLAIPFFVWSGYLMTEGGLSRLIGDFAQSLVGHVRGGALQVVTVTMFVYSGMSGSKAADMAAVASVTKGLVNKSGYSRGAFAASLAAGAAMGETIPPSIVLLILASISSLSVLALFSAGIVPAAVMGFCLMLWIYIEARLARRERVERVSMRTVMVSALRAVPALLTIVVIVGGIVFGIGTPLEVSSFAVVYAGFLTAVYRSIGVKGLWETAVLTATMTGMILFVVSTASAFAWMLTVAQIPQTLAEITARLHDSPWQFMLASIVLFILMGMLLEGLPSLLILAPILVPVASVIGVDPLQFGIVMLIAMGIGTKLPPLGVGLYIGAAVAGASLEESFRPVLPYILVLLMSLLVIAFVPEITLFLPHVLHLAH